MQQWRRLGIDPAHWVDQPDGNRPSFLQASRTCLPDASHDLADTLESSVMATQKTRDKIIDAMIRVMAREPWENVSFDAIANEAGIGLGTLRENFTSRVEILAAFTARVDRRVLDGRDPDMADEAPRERLFDIMFARFEALQPHRDAIASLLEGVRRDLALALALNRLVTASMGWMLSGARIGATGPAGQFRAQGLAFVWVRTLRVWLKDDDPGLARTMAELDKQLRSAERNARRFERLRSLAPGARRRGARRPDAPSPDGPADVT